MKVEAIWKFMLDNWGFCAFVIAMFVQITPTIKFSPLTWLGGLMTGGLKKDIEGLQKAIDENEKDRIRWEVLDFANTCRNGLKHTKDEFQHVIALHDKYTALLKKTNDSNGVFDEEYAYIVRLYHERQERNDFL